MGLPDGSEAKLSFGWPLSGIIERRLTASCTHMAIFQRADFRAAIPKSAVADAVLAGRLAESISTECVDSDRRPHKLPSAPTALQH